MDNLNKYIHGYSDYETNRLNNQNIHEYIYLNYPCNQLWYKKKGQEYDLSINCYDKVFNYLN
jgi:hypothetical protein